ncbi:MAG: hypothetical protein SNJ82_08065 [Gemmataceae bacterium]
MNLFDSELLNLVFGAVGAVLGYWLRGSSRALTGTSATTSAPLASSSVAPELIEALRLVLDRHCQKQTQLLLKQLLGEPDQEKRP